MRINFGDAPLKKIADFCARNIIKHHGRGEYDGVFFKSYRDPLHYELYLLIYNARYNPEGNFFRCVLDIDDETHQPSWAGQYYMCLNAREVS